LISIMPVSRVQSVVVAKKKFDSLEAARKWCNDNNFKSSKVDTTEESYRFRQFDPDECKGKFRQKELTRGITVVLCIEG